MPGPHRSIPAPPCRASGRTPGRTGETHHMDVTTRPQPAPAPAVLAETTPEPTPRTMDALIIRGGTRLMGRVEVSGAKNAALPVMAATLLAPGVHTLRNVPELSDTRTMARVMEQLGARVEF